MKCIALSDFLSLALSLLLLYGGGSSSDEELLVCVQSV